MPEVAISEVFTRDVISSFDLHKPQRLSRLFRPFGDQGASHFMMFKDMMFEEAVMNETFGHNELNRYHTKAIVRANVTAPAAGANLSFVLSTDSMDAQNRFYPRKGDTVMLKNEQTAFIWAIDTSTPADPIITLKGNKQALTLGALTAGDEIIIISGAHSEASGQIAPALSGTTYHDNDMQIVKETLAVTGVEMTNEAWIEVTDDAGRNQFYREGQAQMDHRMLVKMDGALTFQDRTVNTTAIDPETGNPVLTTEGAYKYARRRANPFPKASGAFTIPDFDAIDLLLEQNHVGNYICANSGSKRYHNMENILKEYHNDTNIELATKTASEDLFGGRPAQDSVINFRYFTKGGRTTMLKRNPLSNHPHLYGAEGFTMTDWTLFHSLSRFVDPVQKRYLEEMGMRYKAMGDYDRRMEAWSVKGAGPGLKVIDADIAYSYQRTHIGSQNANGQKWVLMTLS